jgi:hypothetical protein
MGLYHPIHGGGFQPPWQEGGRDKYAGTPIVVLGGSGSVGSYGTQFECPSIPLQGRTSILIIKRSYPIRKAVWIFSHSRDCIPSAYQLFNGTGSNPGHR